jgi:hypothetical protein
MRHSLAVVGIVTMLLLLQCTAALATDWQEDRGGVQFRIDSATGDTQVGFYLFMKYDAAPSCIELNIDWSVYRLSDPGKILAADHHTVSRHCGGRIASVSTLSPFVTPVPGVGCAARIVLQDMANGISYEREITYVAPVTLPTGIGVNVTTATDKTEDIDLSGLSDDQLESLSAYYETISAGYVQTASGIGLSDFFAEYPVDGSQWVFVVIEPNLQVTQAGPGISIRASYNRLFFLYAIDTAAAATAAQEQLKGSADSSVGSAWAKNGTAGEDAPALIFVDDEAWRILKAAAEEWESRKG